MKIIMIEWFTITLMFKALVYTNNALKFSLAVTYAWGVYIIQSLAVPVCLAKLAI